MPRRLAVLLCMVVALGTRGSFSRLTAEDTRRRMALLQVLGTNAYTAHLQGRPAEAVRISLQGYEIALKSGHSKAAAWFLNLSGSAHFEAGEYRQALDDYLSARDFAIRSGLQFEAAVTLSNLSSLYSEVFDTASALTAAEDAYRRVSAKDDPMRRAQILAQIGRVLFIRGDGKRAVPFFEESIRVAFQAGDVQSEAADWDLMGTEWVRSGDLKHAEEALTRAFGLRTLNRDPNLAHTEYMLARLRLKQGQIEAARRFVEQALVRPRRDRVLLPLHLLHLVRAQILAAQHDLQGSLASYLLAVDAADEWRSRGLFADTFRISADVLLDEVYSGAVEAAADLYDQTGEQRYAVLAWQLSERNRTTSLRELLLQGREWTRRVPPEYWQTLERLRAVDAEQYGFEDVSAPAMPEEAARLRMRLAEMEARAGAQQSVATAPANAGSAAAPHVPSSEEANSREIFQDRISLIHFRQVLGNSRTLISFHVGPRKSYRWVVSADRFELTVLPGGHQLGEQIDHLRSALREGAGDSTSPGEKLYSDLFSGIASKGAGERLLIAVDEKLFELPIAALVCGRTDGKPEYLVEKHTIELVPGAWAIGPLGETPRRSGFVGVGDAVYNTADPRYVASGAKVSSSWQRIPALFRPRANAPEMPRLISSRKEVTECARRGGAPVTILTGTGVNRAAFVAAVANRPGIIHIAAHFLSSRNSANEGYSRTAIVLGLHADRDGRPGLELLTADDIASLQVPGAIVVLSGCSSASGQIVPAAGLLGLARAWLTAGAQAVIATHWPTPDDTGELLSDFYEHLRDAEHGDKLATADALRRAQVDMLRSGTWRAEPRYWAAYEIVGRSN